MAFRLIRFGTKAGIAYAAIHYTSQQGIWSGTEGSVQVFRNLRESAAPYLSDSPIKIPELPRTDQLSFLMQHYWNKGVIATFAFLMEVPDKAVEWSKLAYEKTKEQLQQKS